MSTNLALDDGLIESAKTLGNHRSKKETVTVALQEYIQRLQQRKAVAAFGTIDYDPKYDYKLHRKSK